LKQIGGRHREGGSDDITQRQDAVCVRRQPRIVLAIALRAARDGANVALAAKTAEPHPKLKGTIYTAAEEVRAAGGKALPILCDIRDEAQVIAAIDKTVAEFGGIDICVNNASAISLTDSQGTDMKRFDLMMGINTRWYLHGVEILHPASEESGKSAHSDAVAPLDMQAKWFERLHRLHHGEVRHEHVRARPSAELKAAGVAVKRAVAAHRDCHRRGQAICWAATP